MKHTDAQARLLLEQESEFDGSYIIALREALRERIRPSRKDMIERVEQLAEEMRECGEWYDFMLWDEVAAALREMYKMPKEMVVRS